ncbi:hypothetical protein [Paenibacillus nasutitermitis]|uniref:Uncharacterized protein n=1 Tax=Paenibacillus nasutitermitis TaxID=1652958 RepID=A0A917DQQ5_9BACL|nr:hypothetical protein [Paenibacillus nasutitermitis]GGD57602.1 hypothetical protein GCM10010911_14270 [Paenibacillus nasutitermitis]
MNKSEVSVTKKVIVIILLVLTFAIIGCNRASFAPLITIEYLKEHAKIDMTEEELRDVFGHEVFNEFGDGSDVMIFDKTKSDFKYSPDLQHVAFQDIMAGNVQYQLYINLLNNKAFMYSYFYLGTNNEIWVLTLSPDGEWKQTQSSNPK